jgi:hypothetical protein
VAIVVLDRSKMSAEKREQASEESRVQREESEERKLEQRRRHKREPEPEREQRSLEEEREPRYRRTNLGKEREPGHQRAQRALANFERHRTKPERVRSHTTVSKLPAGFEDFPSSIDTRDPRKETAELLADPYQYEALPLPSRRLRARLDRLEITWPREQQSSYPNPVVEGAATRDTSDVNISAHDLDSFTSGFAAEIFQRIRGGPFDAKTFQSVVDALPSLLGHFATSLGFNAPLQVYPDIVFVMYKYRR